MDLERLFRNPDDDLAEVLQDVDVAGADDEEDEWSEFLFCEPFGNPPRCGIGRRLAP